MNFFEPKEDEKENYTQAITVLVFNTGKRALK